MSDPQAALDASQVADIPIVTIVRVMNALKAVGYAVVELPKPNSLDAWPVMFDGELEDVYGKTSGEVVISGVDTMSSTEARSLALALLAAADAAEKSEPDPHAGQLWANELQSRQRQVPSDREWS